MLADSMHVMSTSNATRRMTQPGWSLSNVVAATGGVYPAAQAPERWIPAVTTDSRRVAAGSLFVALRGDNHDGHEFVATALQSGARYALVDHAVPGVEATSLILVPDTLFALGDLAAWTRQHRDVKVCAITGSNGKTTTKELLASICTVAERHGRWREVLKTEGNFNNLIGLPLTLLRLGGEDVAVLEMGMNRPGEIARLTQIATPDFAVVTNVGPAHLEGVGGSIEGVARAKGELFAGMAPDAAIAVNMEDEWVARIATPFRGRKVTFGSSGEVHSRAVVDCGLDGLRFDVVVGDRTAEVNLRMIGMHNVSNALAAAALAHLMELPIEIIAAGLSAAVPPPERLQIVTLPNGVTLIDDAYNANPSSVEAAFKALRRMPGRSVVVLGDMRELGDESGHAHHQVGERATALGIDELFVMGDQAENVVAGAVSGGMPPSSIHVCATHEETAHLVSERWRAGDRVLVKGSHGVHMENVVRLLRGYGDST